ncbi:MAG: hypothetical protein V4844_12075 [Pseudomonadota bacterium]
MNKPDDDLRPHSEARARAARGDFDSESKSDWNLTPEADLAASIRDAARTLMGKLEEVYLELVPDGTLAELQDSTIGKIWWTDAAVLAVAKGDVEPLIALTTSYGFCREALDKSRITVPGDAWASFAEATFWHGLLLGMRGGQAMQREIRRRGGLKTGGKKRDAWTPIYEEFQRRVVAGWTQGDGKAIANKMAGELTFDVIKNRISDWRGGRNLPD